MSIASIANIPENWQSQQSWSFAHMAHHLDLTSYIFAKHNVQLAIFPLDPMGPLNEQQWFYQHQLMHDNQNQILGIAGNNLLDVDWKDQAQRAAFIDINFKEHLQACNITGVG